MAPQPDRTPRANADDVIGLSFPLIGDCTPYPHLQRALCSHLHDVGDLVEMCRLDLARRALQMALCIRAELDDSVDAMP
jgi:hypothetical protein